MNVNKIKRGIKNPRAGAAYAVNRLLGRKVWKRQGDLITFNVGGFAGSYANRTEFSAKLYYEVKELTSLIDGLEREVDTSLEIGCGYGRLSPWIADTVETHYALDPNSDALHRAEEQYPHPNFHQGRADHLPYSDDSFDLVLTMAVLHHIKPNLIAQSAEEIQRVLAPGGYAFICEIVRGGQTEHTWQRDIEDYQSLFPEMELVKTTPRPVEPTFRKRQSEDPPSELMIFKC